ncbi:MAG TPA: insulinase family protein, partial [Ohtaekwangia sp.]|nr:insulinase family protein [Ohtaekwangia sp.]
NEYAARIIPASSNSKLVVLSGPEKSDFKLPTGPELLALVDQAARAEIKPYEEKAVATSLMEKMPAAGKITAEKPNPVLGTTELTLSNGVKVILKSTDFKNDQVVMNASRFGGQYLFDAKDRFNAEFAATIATQMGVADFSPNDLRKALAGKNVSVTPRMGSISEAVNGQCSAADIETMLQLTHLYFTQPRKDDELFTSFISKQQALYQNMMSDPQFTFQDSVFALLYNNHPWAPRLPKAESFAQIDQARAFEIYRERFSSADGFTFVIVGAFDPAVVKPMLATYLGSLPVAGKNVGFKDAGVRPVKGVVKKEVRKGTEPKSFIRVFWNGEAPYADKEQLKLQALTEILNIKIIESLREDLGGIYGGGMFGTLNKYPYNNYTVGMSLPCGPENVDKLLAAALAEIDKIKSSGPSADDLNKVKETWRQQHAINLKDNVFWARQLIQSVEMKSDPAGVLEFEKRAASLTTNDIKDAANRYLDMKNYVQVVLNPEQ